VPTREEVFGKPKEPLGICARCKKEFKLELLQKYYRNPEEVYWLCPKCVFQRKVRQVFAARI
jgi:hypothetical protein